MKRSRNFRYNVIVYILSTKAKYSLPRRILATHFSRRFGFFTRTGSRTVSSQIRKHLDDVVIPKSKLTKPKATWVEPRFRTEVEYRDITSEGLLRASSFKGLSKRN